MPDPTTIAGTVEQDGQGIAGRLVIVLSHAVDLTEGVRRVLAATVTGADGGYQLELADGPTEPMIVIAFDDAGFLWAPDIALAAGDRVYPGPFDGVLYQVTIAGDSGATAPDWATLAEQGGGRIGTATVTQVTYQQAQASGPIHPSATGVTP